MLPSSWGNSPSLHARACRYLRMWRDTVSSASNCWITTWKLCRTAKLTGQHVSVQRRLGIFLFWTSIAMTKLKSLSPDGRFNVAPRGLFMIKFVVDCLHLVLFSFSLFRKDFALPFLLPNHFPKPLASKVPLWLWLGASFTDTVFSFTLLMKVSPLEQAGR